MSIIKPSVCRSGSVCTKEEKSRLLGSLGVSFRRRFTEKGVARSQQHILTLSFYTHRSPLVDSKKHLATLPSLSVVVVGIRTRNYDLFSLVLSFGGIGRSLAICPGHQLGELSSLRLSGCCWLRKRRSNIGSPNIPDGFFLFSSAKLHLILTCFSSFFWRENGVFSFCDFARCAYTHMHFPYSFAFFGKCVENQHACPLFPYTKAAMQIFDAHHAISHTKERGRGCRPGNPPIYVYPKNSAFPQNPVR